MEDGGRWNNFVDVGGKMEVGKPTYGKFPVSGNMNTTDKLVAVEEKRFW